MFLNTPVIRLQRLQVYPKGWINNMSNVKVLQHCQSQSNDARADMILNAPSILTNRMMQETEKKTDEQVALYTTPVFLIIDLEQRDSCNWRDMWCRSRARTFANALGSFHVVASAQKWRIVFPWLLELWLSKPCVVSYSPCFTLKRKLV